MKSKGQRTLKNFFKKMIAKNAVYLQSKVSTTLSFSPESLEYGLLIERCSNEYKHYRVVSGTHQDFLVEEYKPFLMDETGTYVSVSVTVKGHTETELFPVLDYRNQPVVKPNAMQINNSLKRCFVKALALHGLGLYVFQGEDIPTPPRIDTKKLNMLETILEAFNEQMGKDMTKTLIEYVNEQTDKLGLLADNVETIEQLSYEQCALMERAIAAKRKELDKK
ncbi:hypothetical protein EfmJHP36_27870 [Enterococcus faecium]|nr:hypothetical protein EfmJHP36_27870 [Enterococcus faecium]